MSSRTAKLQELKDGLAKLQMIEQELGEASWNHDASPRAISDFQSSILQRYQRSKAVYLQRRLEMLVVDHVPTFDPSTDTFQHPHVSGVADDVGQDTSNDDGNNEESRGKQSDDDDELKARRDKALASLETTVQSIHSKLRHMRDSYQAVCSRRKELAQMVQDLEEGNGSNDPNMSTDTTVTTSLDDITTVDTDKNDEPPTREEDIAREQQRLEELQKTKRQLQEKLDLMRKEKLERESRLLSGRAELEELKKEEAELLESGQDLSEFHKKIEELKEMKEFYDNVRAILEELGGVKIVHVREDEESSQHLHLTILVYDEYKVEIELEVFRQSSLKLVNAKWISDPIVKAVSSDTQGETFSMTMSDLDDLVQIAKTSMGPPHDVRFIIRETCARVRIMQNHVDDLAVLRERHGILTKVDSNDRVLCSFNDGIVIVMRLYDHWVRVEHVVGVNGWDQVLTDKIRDAISTRDETLKPTMVVEQVLQEIESLKKNGAIDPATPELPTRQATDDDDVEMKDAVDT